MASPMKLTEEYEFKTDIITAYDGTEQRIKLRHHPRHYLTYDYSAMDLYQAQYLRGIVRSRQSDMWYIPMWHNVAYLAEDFVADGVALHIDNKYLYNFDECEYICIHSDDGVLDSGSKNITREVRLYTESEIEMKTPIRKRLDKRNTWIYPVRRCVVKPSVSFQYGYSNGTEIAITFEDLNVKSRVHIPSTFRYDYEYIDEYYNRWNMPETFNDLEVFYVEPKWYDDGQSIELNIEKNVTRMDNDTGVFMYDLKNNNSYDIHSYTLVLDTRPKINNYIKFFKRMCGRYKTFYMPSWANDFEVARGIRRGSNYIYTEFTQLYKFYLGNGRKKYIIIFTKDWQSYIYPIMTYTYETLGTGSDRVTYGKLILSEPVQENIPLNNILMCSYFNLVRFDDDSLTIGYETNIVGRITMSVKEVDK